jgi:hypothetical protein
MGERQMGNGTDEVYLRSEVSDVWINHFPGSAASDSLIIPKWKDAGYQSERCNTWV